MEYMPEFMIRIKELFDRKVNGWFKFQPGQQISNGSQDYQVLGVFSPLNEDRNGLSLFYQEVFENRKEDMYLLLDTKGREYFYSKKTIEPRFNQKVNLEGML